MPESQFQSLCQSCGLCCSGHLFSWVRLNANELDKVENLGLKVIRNDPRQRGFLQPCPVWNGICTVYESPDYPRSCAKYKCKVFRQLENDDVSFPNALETIQETLTLIREVEKLLPPSSIISFRERLIAYKESLDTQKSHSEAEREFLVKCNELLTHYENQFGVDDFIDYEI